MNLNKISKNQLFNHFTAFFLDFWSKEWPADQLTLEKSVIIAIKNYAPNIKAVDMIPFDYNFSKPIFRVM